MKTGSILDKILGSKEENKETELDITAKKIKDEMDKDIESLVKKWDKLDEKGGIFLGYILTVPLEKSEQTYSIQGATYSRFFRYGENAIWAAENIKDFLDRRLKKL